MLIIGAGPAGMASAFELYRAKRNFMLIEKSSSVGGLSKTIIIREDNLEFCTDIGPHRFYTKNEYLNQILDELIHENMLLVRRRTRQYINGAFFDYPINALQIFENLGLIMIIRILVDYLIAFINYRIFKKPIVTFYDYAVANFGKTLARFNMINYTEKIWGLSTHQLAAAWAEKRIKGLSLSSLLKDVMMRTFIRKSENNIKTLIETFYYPEFGTGLIYEKIRERIEHAGYHISLNSHPTRIVHNDHQVKGAILQKDGTERYVEFDYLIESIPIVDFLMLLDPPPPSNVLEASSHLHYRSQVYLFLTLNIKAVTQDQWIYFPDKNIPFARVTEMKNFSYRMSPSNKTSLLVEFFCNEGDKIYSLTREELLELFVPYFEKYGFFKRADIRNYYKFQGSKDYPIYDLNAEANLKIIKDYLNSFDNLFYIGRPGRFEYTSQDQSIEMGIVAARSIIDRETRQTLSK